MLGFLWTMISDPERALIDHWPFLVVLVFVATLPFMFTQYVVLIRSHVVQVLVLCFLLIAVVWTLRGRWDNDQFDKERRSFNDTLQQIDEENLQAKVEADKKVEADAATNRSVLAKAIADAAAAQGVEKGRADALQDAINRMPDVDDTPAPTKDCPKPPPRRPDPTLLQILRGR